jgi:hypothetical protein
VAKALKLPVAAAVGLVGCNDGTRFLSQRRVQDLGLRPDGLCLLFCSVSSLVNAEKYLIFLSPIISIRWLIHVMRKSKICWHL